MEPKEAIEAIKNKEIEGERLLESAQREKTQIIRKAYLEAEQILKLKEDQAKKKAISIREKILEEAKFEIDKLRKETEIKKEKIKEISLKNFDKAIDFVIEQIEKLSS